MTPPLSHNVNTVSPYLNNNPAFQSQKLDSDNKNLTTINIEYRSVEFNNDLTFPFSIPSGYKEISLK
mgnify:CR=1 FL=1